MLARQLPRAGGMDGAVPGRVTEIPATAHPNRVAATMSFSFRERDGESAVEGVAGASRFHDATSVNCWDVKFYARVFYECALRAECDDGVARTVCQENVGGTFGFGDICHGNSSERGGFGFVGRYVITMREDSWAAALIRAQDLKLW